jgi:hypothetical protein
MMHRLTIATILAAAFSFAGCGKDEAVKQIEAVSEAACACKDMKCIVEQRQHAADLLDKYKDKKVGDSDYQAAEAASQRMKLCFERFGSTGSTAPAPAPR